jgi:hypothetical protein
MQQTDLTGTNQPDQASNDLRTGEKLARRKALSRIGKYSAYAIPAVLALTHKAASASTLDLDPPVPN